MTAKKLILSVFLLTQINFAFGNINFIVFDKIKDHEKCKSYYLFVKDNQQYYDHWTPDWKYDQKKEDLIAKLSEAYLSFSSIQQQTTELLLLKGQVAHYLYNLGVEDYYDSAVNNFKRASENDREDYRAPWFLATHYALSNVRGKSIELFLKAQEMKPIAKPADFWDEYAYAMAVAQMPAHVMFAMDRIKEIPGAESNFMKYVWPAISTDIQTPNKDSTYLKEKIWYVTSAEQLTFVNLPLGIKLSIDSNWGMAFYDYSARQSAVILKPDAEHSKNGMEINYSIAILMNVPDEDKQLEDYVNKFCTKYSKKKKVSSFEKYGNTIAYEIFDKSMYENMGGSHSYVIGIERQQPLYPGLALEGPVSLPKGEPGKANFYRSKVQITRFKGRIFYLFLLDTCEDIYAQSFSAFKAFFYNQITIE